MKKLIVRLLGVAVILGGAWWAYSFVRQMPQRRQNIPVTKVRQGDVVIRAFSRGELRAIRSEQLIAPNLMGTVQVTRLAPIGAFTREKDLIVEFDDSEVQSRLEEHQLDVESTDEDIKRQEAELAIRNNQDQVDLLRDQYAVRRAELQVQQNEIKSAIDQRKNLLNLEQAKRTLTQFESDVKSRQEQAQAQLALLRQQRTRESVELSREQMRLRQTRLLASMSGLVSIRQNSFGGSRQFGAQVPDIREGDQVQPGMPVADVLDLSELDVLAKIGELDRANLTEGQETLIELDALAGKKVHGRIKSMSGTATANVLSGDPSKKFDVVFSVDMKELLTTVGASPEQIRAVLATAEKNRNKPANPMSLSSAMTMVGSPDMAMAGGPGGMPDGGPDFGFQQPGAEPGGQADAGQGRRRRGGADGGGQGQGGADRQKMREAMQKALGGRSLQDLSPEERQKLIAQFRPGGGAPGSSGARGSGRGGQSGQGGPPGTPGAGMGFFGAGGPRLTDKELAEAQLPPPPQEQSQLQVLLRPGLLADIEIIVEKIPNAIYIPSQAVFEKDGKPVVYVRTKDRFEERAIKLAKRSESTMVISEGLKPGEVVALSDPTAQRGSKGQARKSESGAGPVGAAASGPKT
jgi:HlyD family secretion protein